MSEPRPMWGRSLPIVFSFGLALVACSSSGSGGGAALCDDAGCIAGGNGGAASSGGTGGIAPGGTGGLGGAGGSLGGATNGGTGGAQSPCQPSDPSCYGAGPLGPGHDCLAQADFSTSSVTTLRVASHQVKSPNALAQPFVQDSVISKKSALNQPQCNINGAGQMNLLLSIDTTQKSITIGGGVPQAVVGAPNDGTCWASFVDPSSGLSVTPVTTSFSEDGGGTLTAFFSTFVLPIYMEDATTSASYFLLPLHEMQLHAKLSSDKNCIGRYAAETLDPAFSCQPASGQFAWQTAGGYQGFIKVDEADNVLVTSLGSTLCVVLTGDPAMWKGPNDDCQSSSGFQATGGLPKGDWCSSTNAPGGCADAWHVAVDIAAQAIDIKGTFDVAAGTCLP